MSADVVLRASADYERPLFYAGQVLPDSELTQLAEFSRSRIEAEVRRNGWGVIYGLLPHAVVGDRDVGITPGVVADQKGRLFVLDEQRKTPLIGLLDDGKRREIEQSKEEKDYEFDLWLVISGETSGFELARQAIAQRKGRTYAPEIDNRDAGFRRRREALIATLQIRPSNVLQDSLDKRADAFEEFRDKFNAETPVADYQKLRTARRDALVDLFSQQTTQHDGIPLGRITASSKDGAITIKMIDWARGRRDLAVDELPARPGYVNVAGLFETSPTYAEGWLARRGIMPSTKWLAPLGSAGVGCNDKRFVRPWQLELRPGDSAKLYVADDRVAFIKKGADLSKLWWAVIVVFMLLVQFAAVAYLGVVIARSGTT